MKINKTVKQTSHLFSPSLVLHGLCYQRRYESTGSPVGNKKLLFLLNASQCPHAHNIAPFQAQQYCCTNYHFPLWPIAGWAIRVLSFPSRYCYLLIGWRGLQGAKNVFARRLEPCARFKSSEICTPCVWSSFTLTFYISSWIILSALLSLHKLWYINIPLQCPITIRFPDFNVAKPRVATISCSIIDFIPDTHSSTMLR